MSNETKQIKALKLPKPVEVFLLKFERWRDSPDGFDQSWDSFSDMLNAYDDILEDHNAPTQ